MKNTGTVYRSTEKKPSVLPEMDQLLPPLSEEQLSVLEKDILQNGCYAPIIVNEDLVIVDGHNRQRLCEKNGIPYQMAVFSFQDLLEAKQWALDTQKGRRNLDKWELGKIALKLKPDFETRAKTNMSAGGGDQKSAESKSGLTILSNPISSVNTRKELADSVGIGEVTMGKVMQIDEHAPDSVKEALDKKELSINQGYNLTRQLQQLPEEERDQAAKEALEKAKKEIRVVDAEADRRGKISKLFCAAFEKAVLLTPSEENIRIWTECSRMTSEEMAATVQEARELAHVFSEIADTLEQKIIPPNEKEEHE